MRSQPSAGGGKPSVGRNYARTGVNSYQRSRETARDSREYAKKYGLGGSAIVATHAKPRPPIPADAPKTTTSRGSKPLPVLKDKYGRSISRAEYNRREAFREKRKSMTADQAARATKAEKARRKKYREGAGTRSYGKAATTRTRNTDLALGTSSRYINAKTRTAVAKGRTTGVAGRVAAARTRAPYQRKGK